MGNPTKRRLILCFLSILLIFIPLNLWGAVPQGVDTPNKDFNAEAPWRVETAGTPIPFSILIKDVWKNDLKALRLIEIVTLAYPGPEEMEKVYSLHLDDIEIQCARPENPMSDTEGCINGNWELNIYHFRGTEDPALEGKLITPARLGYQTGDDIYFRVLIAGEDEFWIPSEFTKYLKVHVGEPLPKPAADWFYGDTHFHTEYTNDLKEYGGQLTAVRDAAKVMGLDFVTTTDHASDLKDGGWQGWFGCWDLCPESWNDLAARINDLNDGNGLPFIQGEEITCQATEGEEGEGGIHLLVYNNDAFISGKINLANIPQFSLKSRLNALNASALAYAAHPMDTLDIVMLHQIAEWSDQNYSTALADPQFKGLEIWNTRKTKTNCSTDPVCPKLNLDFYVNPFDKNGQWPHDVANWDEGLIDGIEKWDELLRASLEPLRKVFISGGSDAHGDINYAIGGIGPTAFLDDNAMGKVRTLVHAPGGKNREHILGGFRNGRSVVTDGPVVIFGIDRNNDGDLEGNSRDIIIGDDAVVPLSEDVRFLIQWNSTSEFGSIDEIAIFEGTPLQTRETVILSPNNLEGRATRIQLPPRLPGMHYYRIEARVKDNAGNIIYRCLSNPIWISWASSACSDNDVPEDHWYGMYYDNINLSGDPVMVRDDGSGSLDFDWGYDGPGSDCGLGTDYFSARWLKRVYFTSGTYRFTITSDDGFKLYIDGREKLSEWKIQGPTTYNVDVELSEGFHWVIMEYYENAGYATAKLSWEELSPADCIETVTPQHWKGEYFGNKDLSGSPLMVCDDGEGFLDFDWAYSGPSSDCGIGVDNFSARWTRDVYFNAGTYRFTITSDDGFRLYIDGDLKLSKWIIQGPTTYTVDVPFSGGDHDIKLEYYENGGYATARLSWEQLSQTDCVETVSPQHWKGEYFANKDLSGSALMVRDDGSGFLDFDWGLGAPDTDCGIGVDNFSARWTRSVYFTAGTYRFTVTSDDGFRLYIDGALKFAKWIDQGATTYTVDVPLSAGDHTIKLEYYENGGYASARLVWEEVSLTGGWAYPVGSADSGAGWVVTNPLGNSWYSSQNQRWYRGHLGEDWFKSSGSSLGEPVYAASAGKVITVLNNCGNYVDVVIIEHQVEGFAEPIYSFYGHIEADGYVQKGDLVKVRQQIGRLGDPVTFEPHLHFEIKNRTALINPPFSNCSNIPSGVYISAGYSGISDDYNGGAYYDPTDDISGNRYYHPTRFIEDRKDGTIPPETDCSKFVSDLNYPDGTVVAPGQTINKGWRLSNCGDTTWSTASGYRAVRVSGSYGPTSFNIPSVGPGQTGDLYVNITVPSSSGKHRATYKLEGSAGTFGDPFWVEINVQGSQTITVDDGDSGFVLFGPSQYWHREFIGYGGDMYWTYVNGTVVSNKVRWKPQLPGSGNYQVQVFIPYNYATTRSAKYTIKANGSTYKATVNQNIYYDAWVTLGTYYFNGSNNGSEYVELTDATGEAGSTYLQIGFDAVKWQKQ